MHKLARMVEIWFKSSRIPHSVVSGQDFRSEESQNPPPQKMKSGQDFRSEESRNIPPNEKSSRIGWKVQN